MQQIILKPVAGIAKRLAAYVYPFGSKVHAVAPESCMSLEFCLYPDNPKQNILATVCADYKLRLYKCQVKLFWLILLLPIAFKRLG